MRKRHQLSSARLLEFDGMCSTVCDLLDLKYEIEIFLDLWRSIEELELQRDRVGDDQSLRDVEALHSQLKFELRETAEELQNKSTQFFGTASFEATLMALARAGELK